MCCAFRADILVPGFLIIVYARTCFPRQCGRTMISSKKEGKDQEQCRGSGDISPWWSLHSKWLLSTGTVLGTSCGEIDRLGYPPVSCVEGTSKELHAGMNKVKMLTHSRYREENKGWAIWRWNPAHSATPSSIVAALKELCGSLKGSQGSLASIQVSSRLG